LNQFKFIIKSKQEIEKDYLANKKKSKNENIDFYWCSGRLERCDEYFNFKSDQLMKEYVKGLSVEEKRLLANQDKKKLKIHFIKIVRCNMSPFMFFKECLNDI